MAIDSRLDFLGRRPGAQLPALFAICDSSLCPRLLHARLDAPSPGGLYGMITIERTRYSVCHAPACGDVLPGWSVRVLLTLFEFAQPSAQVTLFLEARRYVA